MTNSHDSINKPKFSVGLKKIITATLLLMLAGCGGKEEEIINKASLKNDPLQARAVILSAINECAKDFYCKIPDSWYDERDRYFFKGLNQEKPNAGLLLDLYKEYSYSRVVDTKVKLRSYVIKNVDILQSKELLAAAGYMYGTSSIGVINTEKQIHYFTAAWLKGHTESAGALSRVFLSIKDYENAYLWSLRCNVGCSRDGLSPDGTEHVTTELDKLAKHLSYERISQLQIAAEKGVKRVTNKPSEKK